MKENQAKVGWQQCHATSLELSRTIARFVSAIIPSDTVRRLSCLNTALQGVCKANILHNIL